jgi:hypothetical protein
MPLRTSKFVHNVAGWRGIIHAANIITRFVQKMDTLDVGEAKSDGKGIKYRWQISEEELLKPDQINILTVTLPKWFERTLSADK